MSIRFGWVLTSAAVGIVVLLLIYYMFSLAFSINAHEYDMMNKLAGYKDSTFEHLRGSSDIELLAALGSLIALFAGGMAATLLSRLDKPFIYRWLVPSAIAAIFTMLAVDAYMYVAWDHGVQLAQTGGYGRPIDPSPFIVILFIMLVFDAVCFAASASGGLVAAISKSSKCS
jgi:hypothetical protein